MFKLNASTARQLYRILPSGRVMSTVSPAPKKSNNLAWLASIPVVAGVGYFILSEPSSGKKSSHDSHGAKHGVKAHAVPAVDYKAVANDVAELLDADLDYDGIGHCGPVLVRLAWHCSGTYDAATKTGGSDGATMRFEPESGFAANAGLNMARSLLEPIKEKYPGISYGDLWTLAGVVAIKEMGGPTIAWRAGRQDKQDGTKCPRDGLLPDGSKGASHIRDIFGRMGFDDQEIVALSGAHSLGKCHVERSGFKGPWTFSPTSFTNAYYTELLNQTWVPKKTDKVVKNGKKAEVKWTGPAQYVDKKTGELMMLETDISLIKDPSFRKHVEVYAKDQSKFFEDFGKAFGKLIELGCSDKVTHGKPVGL